ncbi:hypothetical protein KAU11_06915 [Candidatus Babeliales bacterium]|nr:hypothetical protein [Candidatus Babeliales bacterium]
MDNTTVTQEDIDAIEGNYMDDPEGDEDTEDELFQTGPLNHRTSFESTDKPLTLKVIQGCMPKRFKNRVNQGFVDTLNNLADHGEVRDAFRENMVGYSDVLNTPGVKLSNYIQAVKYVSYKMLGYTNQESWIRAFPERFKRLTDRNGSDEHLRAIVSKYNKGILVNKIMEQTLVPTYVLNHDIFQKAINTQAKLMVSAVSEKVRSDAANSLLTHLKQPEVAKATLDITIKEDDSIRELRNTTLQLARQQREMLQLGSVTTKEVAESKLLIGECERIPAND